MTSKKAAKSQSQRRSKRTSSSKKISRVLISSSLKLLRRKLQPENLPNSILQSFKASCRKTVLLRTPSGMPLIQSLSSPTRTRRLPPRRTVIQMSTSWLSKSSRETNQPRRLTWASQRALKRGTTKFIQTDKDTLIRRSLRMMSSLSRTPILNLRSLQTTLFQMQTVLLSCLRRRMSLLFITLMSSNLRLMASLRRCS